MLEELIHRLEKELERISIYEPVLGTVVDGPLADGYNSELLDILQEMKGLISDD